MPISRYLSSVRRAAVIALAALPAVVAAGLAAPSDSTKTQAKPPITQVHGAEPGGASTQSSRKFHPIPLPDSLGDDIHAAWRLRARVGKAYWPQWITHPPAPLVVRGNPFDFFILHPDPPSATTAPKPIEGGGYYYVSLERLKATPERDTRIEEINRWWSVSYDLEGGRGSATRPQIASMLADRDFMVFEMQTWRPQWAGLAQMDRVLLLRSNPDLRAWLDSEAVALRSAILSDDAKLRSTLARKAIRARGMADEIASHDMKLQGALDWYEAAVRAEGATRYVSLLLDEEAKNVVAGDTSYAMPTAGGDFAFRAKVWRTHLAHSKERDVTGLSLTTLREIGAMYCVLLDASQPGWQADFFNPATRSVDLLSKVLAAGRNSKIFSG
jgi:hypothetical protein